MSFDVTGLPDPDNRTPQQWVVFYLRLEDAIAQNKMVTVGNRSYTSQDLDTIVKLRLSWQSQIGLDAVNKAERYAPIYLG